MGWSLKAMRWLEWGMYLVFLNVLWLAGTAAGLGILGFFPATAALMVLFQKKEAFAEGQPLSLIARDFFQQYKHFFRKANGAGLAILVLLAIVYVDWTVVQTNAVMQAWFSWPLLFLGAYLLVLLALLFPLAAHARGSWKARLRLLLLTPFLAPGSSLLLLAIGALSWAVTIFFPLLFLLVGASGTAWLLQWAGMRALTRKGLLRIDGLSGRG